MYKINIWGNEIQINGAEGVFSPNNLDLGTKSMLEEIEIKNNDKVLDLGCGTGVVGIAVAKLIGSKNIVMVDIDSDAIECCRNNLALNDLDSIELLQSDGFKNVYDSDFTLILSNPPYHTDFSVAKEFIESGKKHLKLGGKMVLVVKRLEWYKNKMVSIFGGLKIVESNGYYILISEKRDSNTKVVKKEKTVNKKHLKKLEKSKKH